ncbi:hypothetical protein CEE45_01060 [Candidatus Heimdallarchaeota archaeon B3_Heim]|nr:MAG: hypothetical protein CEE45_01060 [Candidatus Heimdallarchaeota archaeon B3_Heim]
MAPDLIRGGLLDAHKNYLLGQSSLLQNSPIEALDYFNQSQKLFKKELNGNPDFLTHNLWDTELKILEQTIVALEPNQKSSNITINQEAPSKNSIDSLISSMRTQYEAKKFQRETIGLKLAKQTLKLVIELPLNRSDIWMLSNNPPRSILFFGPPGCGKSLLATDEAKETGLPLYDVTPGKIISKWFGESEKNIDQLFHKAHAEPEGCILLFDEFDAIAGNTRGESEAMTRVRKALLTALDGYKYKKHDSPNKVTVIATTNRPDRLEGAMMRRFDRRVYIPSPNEATILQLITSITNKAGVELDFYSKDGQALIQSMLGLTAKEITNIVHGAIWETADVIIENNEHMSEKLQQKIHALRRDMTPYFCTFEALEPSTFRFLDYQYGFPKTKEPAYTWEPALLQQKHRLIQLHPKPKIIQKRKLQRQI